MKVGLKFHITFLHELSRPFFFPEESFQSTNVPAYTTAVSPSLHL